MDMTMDGNASHGTSISIIDVVVEVNNRPCKYTQILVCLVLSHMSMLRIGMSKLQFLSM